MYFPYMFMMYHWFLTLLVRACEALACYCICELLAQAWKHGNRPFMRWLLVRREDKLKAFPEDIAACDKRTFFSAWILNFYCQRKFG